MDFEPTLLPKDIKRAAREEWHYMLWLQGRKYREIEVITGFERRCIWRDINRVQDRLAATPRDMESVREMALMSLRVTRSEVMASIRQAHDGKDGRGNVPWGHIAKLYDVAAGIDRTILERYTQAATISSTTALADIEKSKVVLDYMVSKFGPEALDGFDEYYTRNLALKKAKPVKAEQA